LPAVAFVPGRAGSIRPAPRARDIESAPVPPERWRENEAWLHGVDLWNHGFLWEAHEAWERTWRAPFDARQAEFMRGMIQCAAAALKTAIGKTRNAGRLWQAGIGRIERAVRCGRYMGLDVRAFADDLRAFGASEECAVDAIPRIDLETGPAGCT
jgi:hypothetical protein